MAKLKITISFKEKEKDLYDFIKSKRDCSCYIKDLVEDNMNSKATPKPPVGNNDTEFDF